MIKAFNGFILSLSFAVVFVAFIIGFIGFHNMDNCVNGMLINKDVAEFNIKYGENNLYRNDVPMEVCYMEGILMTLISITVLGYFAIAGIIQAYVNHYIEK